MKSARWLIVLAVVLVPTAAAAFKAIPSANGVIHACYDNQGNLRVIDPPTGSCKRQETPIDWNQQGPAGAPGSAGWALVTFDGRLVASSPNLSQANVTGAAGNPGIVCFQNLPFFPNAVFASPEPSSAFAAQNRLEVAAEAHSVVLGCTTPDIQHAAWVSGWNDFAHTQAGAADGVYVSFL